MGGGVLDVGTVQRQHPGHLGERARPVVSHHGERRALAPDHKSSLVQQHPLASIGEGAA